MLNALVYGKDRQVAGTPQATVVEQGLQRTQHARTAVGAAPNLVHEVCPRQMQVLLRYGLALVGEQAFGGLPQNGSGRMRSNLLHWFCPFGCIGCSECARMRPS